MSDQEYYFVSSFNDQEKFIKTTGTNCEIIINVAGNLVLRTFPSPYPSASEENCMEISKKKYEELKKQVINREN